MAKKNIVQEQYSTKDTITISITVKDKKGQALNGVIVKKPKATAPLGSTNTTGVVTISTKVGEALLLEKSGYVTKEFTVPNETSVTETLSEKVVVFVIDEAEKPLQGVDVIAFDRAGKPYEKSAEAILENGSPIGKYIFHQAIDELGTIALSLSGYITRRYNINGQSQFNTQLFSDTPEHQDLHEVQEQYEQISGLITGNSPDNDTVDQKCLIKLPDINRKIKERLSQ